MSLEFNARLAPTPIDFREEVEVYHNDPYHPLSDPTHFDPVRYTTEMPIEPSSLNGEEAYVGAMQNAINHKDYERVSHLFEDALNRNYCSPQIFSLHLSVLPNADIKSAWEKVQQYGVNDQHICLLIIKKYTQVIRSLSNSEKLEQAYQLYQEGFALGLVQYDNFFRKRFFALFESMKKPETKDPIILNRIVAQAQEVYRIAKNENQMTPEIEGLYHKVHSRAEEVRANIQLPPTMPPPLEEGQYVRFMQTARHHRKYEKVDRLFQEALDNNCRGPQIFGVRLVALYGRWKKISSEIFEENKLTYYAELESIWTKAQKCEADDDHNKNVYHNILELKRRPHNQV